MIKWEYTFYISSVRNLGIRDIPSIESLWDENGYYIRGENTSKKAFQDSDEDVINSFGQRGWELVSITPISFLINRNEIGQTAELLLTFKKPVE